ncbi:MAG: hypothetical protein ACRC2R_26070 [Xenococcaceae cyanobacterium]
MPSHRHTVIGTRVPLATPLPVLAGDFVAVQPVKSSALCRKTRSMASHYLR